MLILLVIIIINENLVTRLYPPGIDDMPVEVLERILTEAGVAMATDQDVDFEDVLRTLSDVTRQWCHVIEQRVFRHRFFDRLVAVGMYHAQCLPRSLYQEQLIGNTN